VPEKSSILSYESLMHGNTAQVRCLFILDKGKPVARPGRKATGRSLESATGSRAAEGMLMAGAR
jgi:hypothetical protein